jgi:hypothetical protein
MFIYICWFYIHVKSSECMVTDYLKSFYLNFNNIQCSVCRIYVLLLFASKCVNFALCRTIKY